MLLFARRIFASGVVGNPGAITAAEEELGAADRLFFQFRVSEQLSGAGQKISVALERSNDGVTWELEADLLANAVLGGSIDNLFASVTSVAGRWHRLTASVTGSTPVYVETWVTGRGKRRTARGAQRVERASRGTVPVGAIAASARAPASGGKGGSCACAGSSSGARVAISRAATALPGGWSAATVRTQPPAGPPSFGPIRPVLSMDEENALDLAQEALGDPEGVELFFAPRVSGSTIQRSSPPRRVEPCDPRTIPALHGQNVYQAWAGRTETVVSTARIEREPTPWNPSEWEDFEHSRRETTVGWRVTPATLQFLVARGQRADEYDIAVSGTFNPYIPMGRLRPPTVRVFAIRGAPLSEGEVRARARSGAPLPWSDGCWGFLQPDLHEPILGTRSTGQPTVLSVGGRTFVQSFRVRRPAYAHHGLLVHVSFASMTVVTRRAGDAPVPGASPFSTPERYPIGNVFARVAGVGLSVATGIDLGALAGRAGRMGPVPFR